LRPPIAKRDRSEATNHHRYGEVKTRLTIDDAGQIARYYHIFAR